MKKPAPNWLHARVRSTPRLLAQAPRWVCQVFGHDWAPVEALSVHPLGGGGAPEGLWLTAGGGVTSAWQQAANRLAGLYNLGYGVDEVACSRLQDYFAQSLAG